MTRIMNMRQFCQEAELCWALSESFPGSTAELQTDQELWGWEGVSGFLTRGIHSSHPHCFNRTQLMPVRVFSWEKPF